MLKFIIRNKSTNDFAYTVLGPNVCNVLGHMTLVLSLICSYHRDEQKECTLLWEM